MQYFRNAPIRRKFSRLFAIIAFMVMVSLGMVGGGLHRINAEDDEITNDHLPQALMANGMDTAVAQLDADLRALASASTPDALQRPEARIAKNRALIDKSLGALKATDLDDNEAGFVTEFTKGWASYGPAIDRIKELAAQGHGTEAMALIAQNEEIAGGVDKALGKLIDYQRGHIAHATAAATSAYWFSVFTAL